MRISIHFYLLFIIILISILAVFTVQILYRPKNNVVIEYYNDIPNDTLGINRQILKLENDRLILQYHIGDVVFKENVKSFKYIK